MSYHSKENRLSSTIVSSSTALPKAPNSHCPQGRRHETYDDPFAGRDTFPPFEEAFFTRKARPSSPTHSGSDSSLSSSSVNLSIGVHAALHEHLRQVARYGVDNCLLRNDDDYNVRRQSPLTSEKNHDSSRSLDLLLDVRDSSNQDNDHCELETTQVQTDYDCDSINDSNSFFSSSRVNLLRTPESNRSQNVELVTITRRRKGESTVESASFVDECSSFESLPSSIPLSDSLSIHEVDALFHPSYDIQINSNDNVFVNDGDERPLSNFAIHLGELQHSTPTRACLRSAHRASPSHPQSCYHSIESRLTSSYRLNDLESDNLRDQRQHRRRTTLVVPPTLLRDPFFIERKPSSRSFSQHT